MEDTFKPKGYSTVSPYLIVTGAHQVIDFLREAFGARELIRFDMPDGSVAHAELQLGDSIVMIGAAGPNWPPVQAHVHVYVEEVDRCYQRALKAGGVSVQVPERRGQEPNRRAGVKDPGGNTWWIATKVA